MAGLAGSELGKCIQSIAPEWGHVTSALKIRSLEEDDVLHLPYFLWPLVLVQYHARDKSAVI